MWNHRIKIFTILVFSIHSFLHGQEYYNSEEFQKIKEEEKSYLSMGKDSIQLFISKWEDKVLESGDSVAIAFVWMTACNSFIRAGENEKALSYGYKAQGIIERHILKGPFTYNKSYIASLEVISANYEKSIQLALESIDEFNEEDPYQNQFNYYILADAYLSLFNYEKMDYYLQKWYTVVKEKNIRKDLGFAIYNIHEFYDHSGMYEKASQFREEFYRFYAEKDGALSKIPEHAFIKITDDTPQENIVKLEQYLPYHIKNKSEHLVSRTYFQIGNLYLSLNKPLDAIPNLEKAIHYGKHAMIENKISCFYNLADAYNQIGDYKNAYLSSLQYVSLSDSFKTQQVLLKANDLEAKYENEKKELLLEVQESQIQTKNKWLIFSAIVGLIILTLAGFVFFIYRKLKFKSNIVSKALAEKETLLQEIHHRVKNNLQVISSLLSLQSKYVKDETAVSALNEGQNRVESMALIHQNLYREDNISGVNMKNYVPLLAESIFNSYNIRGDQVSIDFDIDDITLDVATVIPIGLVLNELISNALKYAFPDGQSGQLNIKFNEEIDHLVLIVQDNGIGLEDKNLESGFGSKLIKSFTRKLEGDLNISSNNGTHIEILIRNYKRA